MNIAPGCNPQNRGNVIQLSDKKTSQNQEKIDKLISVMESKDCQNVHLGLEDDLSRNYLHYLVTHKYDNKTNRVTICHTIDIIELERYGEEITKYELNNCLWDRLVQRWLQADWEETSKIKSPHGKNKIKQHTLEFMIEHIDYYIKYKAYLEKLEEVREEFWGKD